MRSLRSPGLTVLKSSYLLYPLFSMISAAITPGTQPHRVRIKTITMEPHPWSNTANGGKRMERRTRINDMKIQVYSGKNTEITYSNPSKGSVPSEIFHLVFLPYSRATRSKCAMAIPMSIICKSILLNAVL